MRFPAHAAAESKLDIFGTVVLGATTAVGGGVLRDVLLGITPPVMFVKPVYVAVALAASLGVFALEFTASAGWRTRPVRKIINGSIRWGSPFFSSAAATSRFPWLLRHAFLVIFIGTLTGVGGGILRDIFIRKIPSVLRKKVYAVAAITGGAVYYALLRAGAGEAAAMLCGMAIIILLSFWLPSTNGTCRAFPKKRSKKEYI